MSDKMLISANDVIPLDIFLNRKHSDILSIIKKKATLSGLDVKIKKDRDMMISTSAKVASSKTFLEKIGKELADNKRAEIEKDLTVINSTRREIKETLDELKAEVRQPVTDWENEKKEAEAKKKLAIEKKNDHIEAVEINQYIDDKKALEADKERLRKEEEKRQVEAQAKIDAEKRVETERLKGLQREQYAKQELERAKINAKIAEENQIRAEKQVVIDQQIAIENTKKEAERKAAVAEQFRLQEENRVKQEQQQRENDKAHRKAIGREVLNSMIENGINEDWAKSVIILVAQGLIAKLKIEY